MPFSITSCSGVFSVISGCTTGSGFLTFIILEDEITFIESLPFAVESKIDTLTSEYPSQQSSPSFFINLGISQLNELCSLNSYLLKL